MNALLLWDSSSTVDLSNSSSLTAALVQVLSPKYDHPAHYQYVWYYLAPLSSGYEIQNDEVLHFKIGQYKGSCVVTQCTHSAFSVDLVGEAQWSTFYYFDIEI